MSLSNGEQPHLVLAKMIGAQLVIEPAVSNAAISLDLINTNTNLVLKTLCEVAGCIWQFDWQTGELRIRGRQ